MNAWIRWIFLALVLFVPAAALAGGGSEPANGESVEREVPEWAQKLYRDPPEFKVFEIAGHRFRVPHKYSRQSSEDDPSFQMSVLWPTLDPYWTDKPQPRDREDFDTLQVTVRSLSSRQYERRLEGQQWHSDQVHQEGHESPDSLEQVHDLWHIEGHSHYVSFKPMKIGEVTQHVVIRCGSANCYIGYLPMERVGVHIRFAHPILSDWRNLIERINGLLNEYKEK